MSSMACGRCLRGSLRPPARRTVMQRTAVRMGLTLFFTLSAMVGASAQDIKGGRDHPLAKRFPGSTIVRYDKQNSALYTLPTGPVVKWDYVKGQPDFGGRKLELEG